MNNPSNMFEFIRLYPKLAADPVVGRVGEIYYNISNSGLRICVSTSPLTWKNIGSGGSIKVDLYNPISTTLPTGPSVTIDGVVITNGMTVLFSNLSSGNNRIYKVSGVGTSLSWVAQADWANGLDAATSDRVDINFGTGFTLQEGVFTGSTFRFGDVTRFFSGTDYWELSGLKTFGFANNATANVFNVNVAGSENMIIDYSIVRGTSKATSTLHITSDGTNVSFSDAGAILNPNGVTFNIYVSSGVIWLDLAADNSGTAGSFKYFIRRWSNNPGGPGGIPNYSFGSPPPGTAAGTSGDVQFNAANSLAADGNFKWDSVNKELNLNGFFISALSAQLTLPDNTSGIIFTYPTVDRFATMTFGIWRNGNYKHGRFMAVTDGVNVNFEEDFVTTNDPAVILSAQIVGATVQIMYLTAATGQNALMRFSINKFGE